MDNMTKGALNVIQWKARSILPKIHFLQNFFHQHDLDLIAICESWLTEKGKLAMREYDILRKIVLTEMEGGQTRGTPCPLLDTN
jgi:hypothetical protein